MVYKQTILPFLVYAGFMFVACNIEKKKKTLHICTKVKLKDHVRIQDSHT